MDRHNVRDSRSSPHGLGRSGPRSAAGHGGIHLSALRRGDKRMPGASVRYIISRMVFCRICKAK